MHKSAGTFLGTGVEGSGQAVLAAATLGGVAYDDEQRKNGVFTAAVLDGLGGAAHGDDRGFITVRTLADYVQAHVVRWVDRERPGVARERRGITYHVEGAAGDLPLARTDGRPLAPLPNRLAPFWGPRRRWGGGWLGTRWRGLSRRARAAVVVAASALLVGVGWYVLAGESNRQTRKEVPIHLMSPVP